LAASSTCGFPQHHLQPAGFPQHHLQLEGIITMSATTDLAFCAGEDITLNLTMSPVENIAGWTLTGTVRDRFSDAVVFTFTPTVVSGPAGTFTARWRTPPRSC